VATHDARAGEATDHQADGEELGAGGAPAEGGAGDGEAEEGFVEREHQSFGSGQQKHRPGPGQHDCFAPQRRAGAGLRARLRVLNQRQEHREHCDYEGGDGERTPPADRGSGSERQHRRPGEVADPRQQVLAAEDPVEAVAGHLSQRCFQRPDHHVARHA
jgi:hypothetical protein